jgi:hypothetical protein
MSRITQAQWFDLWDSYLDTLPAAIREATKKGRNDRIAEICDKLVELLLDYDRRPVIQWDRFLAAVKGLPKDFAVRVLQQLHSGKQDRWDYIQAQWCLWPGLLEWADSTAGHLSRAYR